MQQTFTHSVTYTNLGRLQVADVAASLLANERLMREALLSLEALFPGLSIQDVEVVFRRASSDSPLQEAIEAVGNVLFQEDMIEHVPAVIEGLTGWDIPEDMNGLVTIIVMALVLAGISWTSARLRKKEDTDAGLKIQGNYNQVIQHASVTLQLPPGAIERVIQARFERGRGAGLARKALDFIRPAQREEGAAIVGAGIKIEAETIAAAPSVIHLDAPDEGEVHEPYTNQPVVIHATDLDHNKSGWAGHLPGVWEKRLPMRLYPTIRAEQIFGRREVKGDIILISRRGSDGEYVPYVFHLVGVDP